MIEGDEVTWISAAAKGERKRRFNRRWLKIHLEWDAARDLVGRLYLVSHGKRTEIAAFLGADERKALAEVLKSAIIRPKI